MIKRKEILFLCVIILVNIVTLVIVHFNDTFAYYLDENNNIITSSFNGEIMLGGGSFTISDKDYSNAHESAPVFWIAGGDFTLYRPTISKSGDGVSEEYDTGFNSALFVTGQGNFHIQGGSIQTDAKYAHAIYSADDSSVTISNASVQTMQDDSNGLMTNSGGHIYASNLNLVTYGNHSASIFNGSNGNMEIAAGEYMTNGINSPSIYSSSDMKATDATFVSKKSPGIVLNGGSKIELDGNSFEINSDTGKNIYMYQDEFSEDILSFDASDNSFTVSNGDLFSISDMNAAILLHNNTFLRGGQGNFLTIDSSHSISVSLEFDHQDASGNIVVNNLSELDMKLNNSSVFEGALNSDNLSNAIHLTLSSDSKLVLTGDSYIYSLDNQDLSFSNVNLNGYHLYVNGKEFIKNSGSDSNGSSQNDDDNSEEQDNSSNTNGNNTSSNDSSPSSNSASSNGDIKSDSSSSNNTSSNEKDVSDKSSNSSLHGENDKVVSNEEGKVNKGEHDDVKNVDEKILESDGVSSLAKVNSGNSSFFVKDKVVIVIDVVSISLILTSITFLLENLFKKKIKYLKKVEK